MRFRLLQGALAVALGLLWPSYAHANCSDAGPAEAAPGTELSPEDLAQRLVRLRDFGSFGSHPANDSLIAVSPDGHNIALQIREADPVSNDYCLSLLIISLRGEAPPVVADKGGEFIKATFSNRRLAGFAAGVILPVGPSWSPDGKWVAYLRRDAGVTRVWRARADGGGAEPLPTKIASIANLKWLEDGSLLIVSDQPLSDGRAAIEEEGRSGYHFDHRVWQMSGARPYPAVDYTPTYARLDPSGNTEKPVPPEQGSALLSACPSQCPAEAVQASASGDGRRIAWAEREQMDNIHSPLQLRARVDGSNFSCAAQSCKGSLISSWWTGAGDLLFMRSEGPALRSRLGLYRWRPGARHPKRIMSTADLLLGCDIAGDELLCARETSRRPRHVVAINIECGSIRNVYDPNPEFARIALGTVERRVWKFPGGEAFGDLVLPLSHRRGDKLPLIIVQYSSRGFLRGGTGDEYPIFAFTRAGYAVLSFHRPSDAFESHPSSNWEDSMRINVAGWADRRRVLAALEAGINELVAEGLVDSDRIGITGLSDGASTVQFALLNSVKFHAAAVSSCCEDMSNYASVGEEYYRDLMSWGYPARGTDGNKFWGDYSLLDNAARVRVPILMQLADDEFRMAVPAYFALQAAKKPVDLRVFADEHHIKWQPAHRFAIYRRSLQWFNFWLLGQYPEDRVDGERWIALRALQRD
ncbi:Dipeptidyl aminopeptidase/acylaminoacyl peptidase [Sphingopyxis sp. YR583]|uniref:Atxe2 family lasso peptide isopeptidase n=1 Tax=Sphingopyxis sp. YR583 TaxID=1881047 RepID=UPI0008A7343B|nr:Atxe2 family lasso peptide isopeptidase [Sphingopyxis sp. YR583]SEH19258.1 Dipeptidyl aminopeptidase/acylaminoacyl peptidase [Sphingopyxis sp. YR583]